MACHLLTDDFQVYNSSPAIAIPSAVMYQPVIADLNGDNFDELAYLRPYLKSINVVDFSDNSNSIIIELEKIMRLNG